MLVNKGDKIVLKKEMGIFTNIGEVCDVVEVRENGAIYFKFGNGFHLGVMSPDKADRYFEKYEEPKQTAPSVTNERIEKIMNNSKVTVTTVFDKCTVVAVQLPNGFVIVESSACVSPENYDEETGIEICMNRIVDKVWELEGYRLQENLNDTTESCDEDCDRDCCDNCCNGCDDCDECDDWNTLFK